jgi:hypothetical protein
MFLLLVVGTLVSTAYLYEVSPKLDKAARAARKYNVKACYDVVHEYLPDLQRFYKFYDAFLLVFLIPLVRKFGTYDFAKVGKDLLKVILPMLAFRCITICASVTTATTSMKRDFGHPIKQLITGSSQDHMWSGHTSCAAALVLVLIKNNVIDRKSEKWIWLPILGTYGLFSAMSRSHYTNDVIIGLGAAMFFYDSAFCGSQSKELFFPCS